MKKRILSIMVVLLAVPVLMGLGSQGGTPGKIPKPDKKFAATFVDHLDVVTDCRDVSIEGITFLEGKRGGGIVTIPFQNITSVLFRLNGDKLIAAVRLADGKTMELTVEKKHRAFGMTDYGTFQIQLIDVKKMTLRRI
ncbi:MAG: hypothetical protein CVU61_14035 [Deltaproteobacteria bacterium HGW-Deltaproteobacteria-19]|jgi:hypothetical protein|nr:MAG: hypothetical protein CVU61_14035 [Deltaproteobacteria bacterium HGW-Deltaproteobacteria-19]